MQLHLLRDALQRNGFAVVPAHVHQRLTDRPVQAAVLTLPPALREREQGGRQFRTLFDAHTLRYDAFAAPLLRVFAAGRKERRILIELREPSAKQVAGFRRERAGARGGSGDDQPALRPALHAGELVAQPL